MDFNSLGLFVLRLFVGGSLAINHGLPKLLDFSAKMNSFPDPLGFGSPISLSLIIIAEFLCSVAIIFGIFTRVTVVPLIIAMSVAFFVFHAHDPFATKELAYLYLVCFVSIFCTGAGKYSVDGIFRGVK